MNEVHITYLGAHPHTHMGHVNDIISYMPTGSYIGLSSKSKVMPDLSRTILTGTQTNFMHTTNSYDSIGHLISNAISRYTDPVALFIHLGHDRVNFAERIKSGLQNNTFLEIPNSSQRVAKIENVIAPKRSHSLSGTRMRQAILDDDFKTYYEHIGDSFSETVAGCIMNTLRDMMISQGVGVKRK